MHRPSPAQLLGCLVVAASAASPALADDSRVRPTCAVIPFINAAGRPGSAYLASTISQSLYPAVAASGRWQLVERARLREILREADLRASDIGSGQPIRIADAQVLIVGEYHDDGGIVTVSGRLVNAADGVVVREATWTGHVSGITDYMAPNMATTLLGDEPPPAGLPAEAAGQFKKACRLLDEDELDAAIKLCTAILERHRNDVPTLLLRGHAQLRKKGWKRYAIQDFERVLDLDEDSVAARLGLARALLGGDERTAEQSLRRLRQVLDRIPDQGEALWLTSVAQQQLDRPAEAMLAAERAVETLPEFAPAWAILAELHLATGTSAKAVAAGKIAVTYAPDDPGVWMVLGDAQWANDDRPAAHEAYRKALTCEPPPELKTRLDARLQKFN